MFKFINKIINPDYYVKFVRLLDKQSGSPKEASDWKIRAFTCEYLIKEFGNDEKKVKALNQIKKESEEKAKQLEIQNQKKYLSKFTEKGCDKFVQVGGRDFALEVWFHKDKSNITVITKNGSVDYKMFGEIPGIWYCHTFGGVRYEITLGIKSPKQILITIDNEIEFDSFSINLEPKI